MTLWFVGAGKYGEREAVALDEGVIGIGDPGMGDLTPFTEWEQMTAEYRRRVAPDATGRSIAIRTGVFWRVAREMEIGDHVVLQLATQEAIALGSVQSEYEYRKDFPEGMQHTRRVQWNENLLPPSEFDSDISRSFGGRVGVHRVGADNAEARVLDLFGGESAPVTRPAQDADRVEARDPGPDIARLARDLVVKKIARDFRGHELARLTGAILEAQGYEVKVSPPGPDGGVDVLAGRGGLGLEAPRICVQVKSGVTSADVTVLRTLQGTMSSFGADYGLLVSWGGFTGPARKEAQQSYFKIRLWDQGDLVDALFSVYDKLRADIRAELPLERIWTLVQSDEEE